MKLPLRQKEHHTHFSLTHLPFLRIGGLGKRLESRHLIAKINQNIRTYTNIPNDFDSFSFTANNYLLEFSMFILSCKALLLK